MQDDDRSSEPPPSSGGPLRPPRVSEAESDRACPADAAHAASSRDGVVATHAHRIEISIDDPFALLTRAEGAQLAAALPRVDAAAAAHLAFEGQLRARVVDDARMSDAHERYSGVSGTTDVLTFDLSEADRIVDADALVCIDEARRQAAALGHAPARELLLYALHALLHCCGFDDADDHAAAAMHRAEDEILVAAGIGATFAPAPRLTERAS